MKEKQRNRGFDLRKPRVWCRDSHMQKKSADIKTPIPVHELCVNLPFSFFVLVITKLWHVHLYPLKKQLCTGNKTKGYISVFDFVF